MFSSQQISVYLLTVFISGFPLMLFSQENAKLETEETENKKDQVPALIIKKSSDQVIKKDPEKLDSVPDKTDPIDPEKELEPEEPEKDLIFREDLIKQIDEIIKKVQQGYPVLAESLSDKKKRAILKSVVNELDRGMEYVPEKEFNSREIIDKLDIKPLPALMIASNRILYIRLDAFSKKSVKLLQEDCASNAKLANKPLGVIIDIRSTQCFDYKLAIQALGLFANSQKLQKLKLQSSFQETIKSPVIILTGKNTAGASEVFAKLLIDMKRGISLGEKTAGIPFRKEKVTLSNGDFLLIPKVPEMLSYIIPESVKPSIAFNPYPQLAYKKISETARVEKEDRCIQRAVELIICLNALGE